MESFVPLSELEDFARSAARSLRCRGRVSGRREAARIRRLAASLRRSEQRFQREILRGTETTEAAGWLLDNQYLARQAAESAARAFAGAERLRAAEGMALISRVCSLLLSSGDGEAEEERIAVFLDAFQSGLALTRQELGLTVAGLCRAALASLAEVYAAPVPDPRRCAVLFTTLRRLQTLELRDVIESVDRLERILRRDPAGIYPRMDRDSRQMYGREISRLAERTGGSEQATAERVLALAFHGTSPRTRHVGHYILEQPLGQTVRRPTGALYAAAVSVPSLALCAAGAYLFRPVWAGALAFPGVFQLVKGVVDRWVLSSVPPRQLPRLELAEGVPPEGKTLCVISTLLTGPGAADRAARRLEEFRLAEGAGKNLLFGLLCDLPESDRPSDPGDEERVARAAEAIEELNRRWGGGFFLFFRERCPDEPTGRFIPWERKRGALLELCRRLNGEVSSLQVRAGDPSVLTGTRYVLTLDADTRPEPESVTRLIAAALHPLNVPETDPARGVVVRGHGVLQPRIEVSLKDGFRSQFARLFAPQGGSDPYGDRAGEVYMDLFASGGFAGKGLIHIGAYLACLGERIPPHRVLSHDALEGAYLRGGTVTAAAFADGFPASAMSWLSRQHRWVRGDWQNLPWVFKAGRDLPFIERWRLLDSLRRSWLSPGLLTALGAFFLAPAPGTCAAAALALTCIFSQGAEAALRDALRPLGQRRIRVFSAALHGAGDALRQSLFRLALLPCEAWTSVSAALCALWRMGVSHRNLLQWQTAEQTEAGSKRGLAAGYRQLWFSPVWGALLLTASPLAAGMAMGGVWVAAPALAVLSAREKPADRGPDSADRDWLRLRAAELWRYYKENCTPEDHFLPPDNVQDSPPAETARRVSPTNLGLALLGALCALKLEVASRQEALGLCENLLSAARRLEKWRGHLYNWYDNRTMKPLSPGYVSTVDSGNLAACLIAGAGALRELGEDQLADCAETLYRDMDFSALYDEKRDLFYIGLVPGERPADSWYDLLESEERLTGYIAVASRQVRLRHWQRLSRARVGYRGFRGMVSWSGTMFEYLMPELFLPLYENSALWESARFALYVQRLHPQGPDALWGKSESAFAALDETNHYRYKAHGVPVLALCRGMGGEKVIAPYSSFLALSVSPRAALANLRKMERDEYLGPYGFWEAVDFTPGRCVSERGSCVRCVMAHHVGMSLAAIANALCGGVVRRWFLSDPAMAAHTALLQEKVPLDGALLDHRQEPGERRTRNGVRPVTARSGEGTDFLHPETGLLSNGAYHLQFTESGVSRGRCGRLLPYAVPRSPVEGGHGIELYLARGGEILSLLPAPEEEGRFSWEFTTRTGTISGERGTYAWQVTASVSACFAGERRQLTIRRAPGDGEAAVILGLEPVMLPERDYAAQPAFGRLGLFTREIDGVLTVRRLARNDGREQYLALACDAPGTFSSDARRFRPGAAPERFTPNTGWQSECFAAVRVLLPAGETESRICFAVCQAGDEAAAVRGARAILAETPAGSLAETAETALGLENRAFDSACALLRGLFWPTRTPSGAELPAVPRERLWKLGVSGDRPIHGVECAGEQSVSAAAAEVRRCALLLRCGADYDLVLLTDDEGDYRRTCRAALEEVLEKLERIGFTQIRGRVHFASLGEDREAVLSAAALWSDAQGIRLPRRSTARPEYPVDPVRGETPPHWEFDGEDRFRFTVSEEGLPPRCWSSVLTGGGLGWIAADGGTGSLWFENARECPVIPWRGDALAVSGPERLFARINGKWESFFASHPGDTVAFGFGEAVWEKTVEGVTLRLTAFLPPEKPVRVMVLESSQRVEVRWCAPLQLAPEREDAPGCRIEREGGALRGRNPRCALPELTVTARCSRPWRTGTSRGEFLSGEETAPERSGDPSLCGGFTLEDRAVLLLGCCDAPELLDPAAAFKERELCREYWRRKVGALRCESGADALAPLLNGWSAYQALACRVLGRASMYQSGGAVGFRDQLQDCVNLLWLDPDRCREHVLVCCAHQYDKGDVQHWWHPGPGALHKGVRTRCSDDLLWLPWAVCEYVHATGDASLCAASAPFLTSPELGEGERSRYERPELSGEEGTVLEHCRRAVSLVLSRGVGPHKLLRMGGGDWNDGFDAMGEDAESVWLTWFASIVCRRFGALLRELGQPEAEKYATVSRMLGQAANDAWDGDRFLRGWYADGTPLGARDGEACAIDSVAQSFAAFCPWADPERVKLALDTALAELWDREHHRVALYAPPVRPGDRSPGYVASYGPGFRENGGQYTHAAVWLARACFRTGRWEEGAALLRDLALAVREDAYGAEPFVLPADVCTAPGLEGRAGWSWYTGAAGWWYRTAWQDMLGFRFRGGEADFDPPESVRERGWRLTFCPGTGEEIRFPPGE